MVVKRIYLLEVCSLIRDILGIETRRFLDFEHPLYGLSILNIRYGSMVTIWEYDLLHYKHLEIMVEFTDYVLIDEVIMR